jgi:hypothetical protein
MALLRLAFFLAMFWTSLACAADDEKKTAPLFTSDDLLEVTLRGPFSTIMSVRSRDEDEPGTLTYTDAEAGEVTLEVEIRTRGRYRHQTRVCPWAPLRLDFKKSAVKGTIFKGSDKMKLVTHCRNGASRYTQALFSEYLAYRIFNQMTDNSFRVRLMRVTYVDTDKEDRERTEFAFLIEHRDQVAKRIGLDVNTVESVEVNQLNGAYTNIASMFQYLIANTDFSPIRAAPGEPCCHNNVLFGDQDGAILAIPYDFDMSGLVDAVYATPNPKFDLHSVRERLYRGRCENNAYLDTSKQAYIDQKQAIFDLAGNLEYYDNGTRKKTVRFIDKFYSLIENPKKFESELVDECV